MVPVPVSSGLWLAIGITGGAFVFTALTLTIILMAVSGHSVKLKYFATTCLLAITLWFFALGLVLAHVNANQINVLISAK